MPGLISTWMGGRKQVGKPCHVMWCQLPVRCLLKPWWVGPSVFHGLQNFKPSHRICPFPQNFDIAAEFYRS